MAPTSCCGKVPKTNPRGKQIAFSLRSCSRATSRSISSASMSRCPKADNAMLNPTKTLSYQTGTAHNPYYLSENLPQVCFYDSHCIDLFQFCSVVIDMPLKDSAVCVTREELWASEVVGFSSEHNQTNWSIKLVTGPFPGVDKRYPHFLDGGTPGNQLGISIFHHNPIKYYSTIHDFYYQFFYII